jgi:hypothetical protein
MASAQAEAVTLSVQPDWSTDAVLALFELPFPELIHRALLDRLGLKPLSV